MGKGEGDWEERGDAVEGEKISEGNVTIFSGAPLDRKLQISVINNTLHVWIAWFYDCIFTRVDLEYMP